MNFNLILPNDESELKVIIENFNNQIIHHRLGRKYIIDEISAPFDHQPNYWKVTIKMTEVIK